MKTRDEFEQMVINAMALYRIGNDVREIITNIMAAWDELVAKNEQDKIAWRNDPLGEIEQVEAKNEKLEAEIETLQDKLDRIISWCNAIPLSVFPEPDFVLVRGAIEEEGITLDAITASNMRHIVDGIRDIAKGEIDK